MLTSRDKYDAAVAELERLMKKRDEIRWKELLNVFAVSKFTLYSGEIGVRALSAEFLDHLQKVPRMLRQIQNLVPVTINYDRYTVIYASTPSDKRCGGKNNAAITVKKAF